MTTPEVNTTINSVLEHPQLGPSLVQWLPLHEVLGSLQLASTGIQSIVEDTLVESYVQELPALMAQAAAAPGRVGLIRDLAAVTATLLRQCPARGAADLAF